MLFITTLCSNDNLQAKKIKNCKNPFTMYTDPLKYNGFAQVVRSRKINEIKLITKITRVRQGKKGEHPTPKKSVNLIWVSLLAQN